MRAADAMRAGRLLRFGAEIETCIKEMRVDPATTVAARYPDVAIGFERFNEATGHGQGLSENRLIVDLGLALAMLRAAVADINEEIADLGVTE